MLACIHYRLSSGWQDVLRHVMFVHGSSVLVNFEIGDLLGRFPTDNLVYIANSAAIYFFSIGDVSGVARQVILLERSSVGSETATWDLRSS